MWVFTASFNSIDGEMPWSSGEDRCSSMPPTNGSNDGFTSRWIAAFLKSRMSHTCADENAVRIEGTAACISLENFSQSKMSAIPPSSGKARESQGAIIFNFSALLADCEWLQVCILRSLAEHENDSENLDYNQTSLNGMVTDLSGAPGNSIRVIRILFESRNYKHSGVDTSVQGSVKPQYHSYLSENIGHNGQVLNVSVGVDFDFEALLNTQGLVLFVNILELASNYGQRKPFNLHHNDSTKFKCSSAQKWLSDIESRIANLRVACLDDSNKFDLDLALSVQELLWKCFGAIKQLNLSIKNQGSVQDSGSEIDHAQNRLRRASKCLTKMNAEEMGQTTQIGVNSAKYEIHSTILATCGHWRKAIAHLSQICMLIEEIQNQTTSEEVTIWDRVREFSSQVVSSVCTFSRALGLPTCSQILEHLSDKTEEHLSIESIVEQKSHMDDSTSCSRRRDVSNIDRSIRNVDGTIDYHSGSSLDVSLTDQGKFSRNFLEAHDQSLTIYSSQSEDDFELQKALKLIDARSPTLLDESSITDHSSHKKSLPQTKKSGTKHRSQEPQLRHPCIECYKNSHGDNHENKSNTPLSTKRRSKSSDAYDKPWRTNSKPSNSVAKKLARREIKFDQQEDSTLQKQQTKERLRQFNMAQRQRLAQQAKSRKQSNHQKQIAACSLNALDQKLERELEELREKHARAAAKLAAERAREAIIKTNAAKLHLAQTAKTQAFLKRDERLKKFMSQKDGASKRDMFGGHLAKGSAGAKKKSDFAMQ